MDIKLVNESNADDKIDLMLRMLNSNHEKIRQKSKTGKKAKKKKTKKKPKQKKPS